MSEPTEDQVTAGAAAIVDQMRLLIEGGDTEGRADFMMMSRVALRSAAPLIAFDERRRILRDVSQAFVQWDGVDRDQLRTSVMNAIADPDSLEVIDHTPEKPRRNHGGPA